MTDETARNRQTLSAGYEALSTRRTNSLSKPETEVKGHRASKENHPSRKDCSDRRTRLCIPLTVR